MAEEGFRLLGEEIRRAIAAHEDPARRLGEAGIAYVLFATAHQPLYSVMFSPELADRRAHPSLEAAVRDYQEAGWMTSRDPTVLQLAAWSSVHGLASLIIGGHIQVAGSDPGRIEAIARAVVRSLVPGFDG